MSPRIVKVARQSNRPIKEVVEVIKQYGIEVLPKPTAMISDKMYDLIIRHYSSLPIGTIFQNVEAKAPQPLSVKEIKLEIVEDQTISTEPKKLEVESPNSNIIAKRKTEDTESDKIADENSVISEAGISNLTKVIAASPEWMECKGDYYPARESYCHPKEWGVS